MSDKLILGMLGIYLIIMIVCMFEKNYARALYWLSASGLQLAILWGMR